MMTMNFTEFPDIWKQDKLYCSFSSILAAALYLLLPSNVGLSSLQKKNKQQKQKRQSVIAEKNLSETQMSSKIIKENPTQSLVQC